MSRRPAHRKWGIRTLWFLGLAAASIIVSNWMRMTGNTDVLLLTFIGLLVGLVGATISTIQGSAPGVAGSPARSPSRPPPAPVAVTPAPAPGTEAGQDVARREGRGTMRTVSGRRVQDVDVG